MRITHGNTHGRVIFIKEAVTAFSIAASTYKANTNELSNSEIYSQEEINRRLTALADEYNLTFSNFKDEVETIINNIQKDETALQEIKDYYDLPEFSVALAVVTASQERITDGIISSIIHHLSGQYHALQAIKDIIKVYFDESRQLEIENKFAKYCTVSGGIQELYDAYAQLEQSPDTTYISLKNLFDAAIQYGENCGIKFTDDEKKLDTTLDQQINEANEFQMKQAMGLN